MSDTATMEAIRRDHAALTAIRQDIHAHPEMGLEETRTAALVAEGPGAGRVTRRLARATRAERYWAEPQTKVGVGMPTSCWSLSPNWPYSFEPQQ